MKKIRKSDFVDKFLSPISKISDRCIVHIQSDNIYALTHNSNDGDTIIFYGKINTNTDLSDTDDVRLNIPDVKRLYRMLSCINQEEIDIKLETNHISYVSPDLKFKYYLLDDGIIQPCVVSLEKINKLTFDNNFVLNGKKLGEILKASSVTPNTDKLYFYTEDGKVYAELTDQTLQNVDSLTLQIADSYNGTDIKNTIPIKLEVFRTLIESKNSDINVKINTQMKILMFEVVENNTTLKYIVSALVK